jgi:hypothetical protein
MVEVVRHCGCESNLPANVSGSALHMRVGFGSDHRSSILFRVPPSIERLPEGTQCRGVPEWDLNSSALSKTGEF